MFISPSAKDRLGLDAAVEVLRAAGEPTRLRALALLALGELSVGELSVALGQSQPRVSRHLKLLTACGLAERTPEGAWVFYRLAPEGTVERGMATALLSALDRGDPAVVKDAERLAAVRAARDAEAASYFEANAVDWERVRALHLPDADIESAILAAAGAGPFDLVVDAGCGAGRMLEVFAPHARRLEGFDLSRQMLAMARSTVARLPPGRAAVRFGDVFEPPLPPASADLVVVHQVLHFLADPGRAMQAVVGLARPGGRIVVVDFAPHDLEFLRERHAHRRLGFTDDEVARWFAAAGALLDDTSALAPEAPDPGLLTVKIWAGARLPAFAQETAA